MKKIIYCIVAALCVMMGCSQEELAESLSVPKGSIKASFEQGKSQSRMAVGEKNALTWTKGDAFLIFDETQAYQWKLQGDGGEATGTFMGEIPEGKLIGAAYPASSDVKVVNGKLLMKLPDALTYNASQCNLPMWGAMTSLESGVQFKHLAALLKISFQDIPTGYNKLTVKADKPLSGTFMAEILNEEEVVENPILTALPADGESGVVTVTFEAIAENEEDNDRMFYLPLPVGNYASIEVAVSNGNKTISLAKWNNKSIERAKVYLASVAYKVTDTTDPAVVSTQLEGLTSDLPSVQVTMTGQIVAQDNAAIEIPVIEDATTNVTLEFEQIPTTSENTPLVIAEQNVDSGSGSESTSTTNDLTISIPTAEDANTHLEINTPTTTVNLQSGKFGKLVATTAQNTLVLGEGVEIGELIVKGGNIRVGAGSKIQKITKEATEEILLILQTGVTGFELPASEELPEGISIVRSIDNKELSAALAVEFENNDNMYDYTVEYSMDANGCLLMKESEMEKVTSLQIGWKDYTIPTLKGIEHFVNLESFGCGASGVTTCDFSKNTKLRDINVGFNNLTKLDLSKNSSLAVVYCSWNEYLSSLILASDVQLWDLSVEHTALKSLTVPNPETVGMLTFGHTPLASLDLSSFTNLEWLNVSGLKLQSLDNVPEAIRGKLTYLGCGYNELTSLDMSQYTKLESLHCEYNDLPELDISGNTAIKELDCMANKIETLDISNTQLGENSTLYCGKQQDGIILNLTLTDEQKTVWNNHWKNSRENTFVNLVGEEPVEMITFEDKSFAEELKKQFGDNVILTDEGKAILEKAFVEEQTELNFWGAEELTSLVGIQYFTNLEKLVCVYHKVTSLDVSGMTKLKVLECWDGQFTSVDVTGCTALEEIYIQKNALTTLDVSDCTGLVKLNCEDNKLTSLDLTKCTNDEIDLYCGNQGASAGEEITITIKLTDAMKTYWKQFLFDEENNEVRVLIDGDTNPVVVPSIGKENW